MALTGNLSAQGFYLVHKLPGTPLGQEMRKAIASYMWNLSRGGGEKLHQGRRCPAARQ